MKVYFIDVPYVSNDLKRSYHKKLEVFEGEVISGSYRTEVKSTTVHRYGKKGWKEYSCSKYKRFIEDNYCTALPPLHKISDYTTFATLELAKAAKLLLIEKMARDYRAKLKEIQALFERNVPDVSEAVEEIKNDYPEYFV